LHAGGTMPLGDLAIVPESQRERCSFLREEQEPLETVHLPKPANHFLRDDRRIRRGLFRSAHAREAYVHVNPPSRAAPGRSASDRHIILSAPPDDHVKAFTDRATMRPNNASATVA